MKKAGSRSIRNEVNGQGQEVGTVRNANHPKKGDIIKVEPIRREKDINLIKKLLADKPRDLAIFTLGINTNLRASDLLKITIGQVLYTMPGEQFTLREKKTKKTRAITMNKSVYESIQQLLKTLDTSDPDAFLFQSRQKVKGGALTVGALNRLVKSWCAEINLNGNYGSHTLRKSFGVAHRTRFGTDIPTLMVMYNHSSQRQTLAYLCIQGEEVKNAFMRDV